MAGWRKSRNDIGPPIRLIKSSQIRVSTSIFSDPLLTFYSLCAGVPSVVDLACHGQRSSISRKWQNAAWDLTGETVLPRNSGSLSKFWRAFWEDRMWAIYSLYESKSRLYA